MLYFVKKENRIEKYTVTYDEHQMEKLKLEIIDKCSEITHSEHFDIYKESYYDDQLKIRNLKSREAKDGEYPEKYKEYFSKDADIYFYSYDEYTFPYLISLIDCFYKGYGPSIKEILNPTFKCIPDSFEKRISDLSNRINNIPKENTEEKKEALTDLERLIKNAKLNANQISVKEYYPKVKELIKLELVDSITIDEFEKLKNFFEIRIDNIVED